MPHHNLPAIDDAQGNFPQAADAGKWNEIKSLDLLADALKINTKEINPARVKSIPDVWAQAASFAQALTKPNHPARFRAIGAWRGLLALLALRRTGDAGYEVEVKQLNLAAESQSSPVGSFASIAHNYAPSQTLDGGLDWSRAFLIRAGTGPDKPTLGMLSPETIVMPGRSAWSVSVGQVPWLQGGPHDPLNPEGDEPGRLRPEMLRKPTPEQLRIIYEFVNALRASLERSTSKGMSPDPVLRRLQEYADDLNAAGARDASPAPKPTTDHLIEDAPQGTIYDQLNKVWIEADAGPQSDAFIVAPASSKGVFSGFILIDETVARTRSVTSDRVVGWRSWRMSNLANPKTFADARADALKTDAGYLLLRPNDIFSDTFVPLGKSEQAQKLVGTIDAHGRGELRHVLLPLRPVALLLMDREELLRRLTITPMASGRWSVKLRIPLKDKDGKTYDTHEIRREYVAVGDPLPDANAGRALQSVRDPAVFNPPAAVAWPDFSHKAWRWNYLFWRAQPKSGLTPITGTSPPQLALELTSEGDPSRRAERLRRYESVEECWPNLLDKQADAKGDVWFERMVTARTDEARGELQRSDFSFEAVLFGCRPGFQWDGGEYSRDEYVYAGIGLLKPPERLEHGETGHETQIAMDFGTTNTTIYAKIGDEVVKAPFRQRLRRVFYDGGGQVDPDYIRFFPPSDVGLPYTTIMQSRQLHGGPERAEVRDQGDPFLWLDYIYFGDNHLKNAFDNIFGDRNQMLHMEFKWSRKPEERRLMRQFVGQAAVMAMAEMVALKKVHPSEMSWRISFPEAMGDEAIGFFFSTWTKLVNEELMRPVAGSPPRQIRPPSFYSEGAAAAVWFREASNLKTPSMIVFDIGGGTTDVSLWRDDRQIWRDSFMIAGRELIIDFFVKNRDALSELNVSALIEKPEYRSRILTPSADIGAEDNTDKVRKAITVLVNNPQFSVNFARQFPLVADTPSGRRLRAGARTMLAGMMYYVGLQLRYLMKLQKVTPQVFQMPSVAFAGRGSTIFKYLHGTDAHAIASPLNGAMAMFKVAGELGDKVDPKPFFSPEPKHEVASGMLRAGDQHRINLSGGNVRDIERVVGDLVTGPARAGGENVIIQPTDPLSRLHELNVDGLYVQDAPEFVRFLEELRKQAKLAIEPSPEAWQSLFVGASREITDYVNKEPRHEGKYEVGPPFIRMLRELIGMIYSGEQAGMVKVRSET